MIFFLLTLVIGVIRVSARSIAYDPLWAVTWYYGSDCKGDEVKTVQSIDRTSGCFTGQHIQAKSVYVNTTTRHHAKFCMANGDTCRDVTCVKQATCHAWTPGIGISWKLSIY